METFVHLSSNYTGTVRQERVLRCYSDWITMEKLDGERIIWDGGRTVGMRGRDVWFSNSLGSGYSTGLWTRGGHIVEVDTRVAWYKALPLGVSLDGELCWGRSRNSDGWYCYSIAERQALMSICRQGAGGSGWEQVRCVWFGALGDAFWHRRGLIVYGTKRRVWDGQGAKLLFGSGRDITYRVGRSVALECGVEVVPEVGVDGVPSGAEGLIRRWGGQSMGVGVGRTDLCLKIKERHDMEVTVTAVNAGNGRISTMMGSVTCCGNGFYVTIGSGFTDVDRTVGLADATGERKPVEVGDRIRITYKGYTRDGVPTEATYGGRRT